MAAAGKRSGPARPPAKANREHAAARMIPEKQPNTEGHAVATVFHKLLRLAILCISQR